MTTIICTQNEVAWDSARTCDDVIFSCADPKVTIEKNKKAYCGAGDANIVEYVVALLVAGGKLREDDLLTDEQCGAFEIIEISRDESVGGGFLRRVYSNDMLTGVDASGVPVLGCGSGWKLALGAYLATMDIHKAVEIAAEHDAYTCGPVHAMTLEALFLLHGA